MSYQPVSGVVPQYSNDNNELASGYYLKLYEANTTTPLSMATSRAGSTLLVKCKLNPDGLPISNPLDNDTVFIPHVDRPYRLVVYRNEADADANNTAAAFLNVPDVDLQDSYTIYVGSVAELEALTPSDGDSAQLTIPLKGGTFFFRAGDQSANITADPRKGIWVAPASDPTGASGAWERDYDSVLIAAWFDADPTGTTDSTAIHSDIMDYCLHIGQYFREAGTVIYANGSYRFDGDAYITTGVAVYGYNAVLDFYGKTGMYADNDFWELRNITLRNQNKTNDSCGLFVHSAAQSFEVSNVRIEDFHCGVFLTNAFTWNLNWIECYNKTPLAGDVPVGIYMLQGDPGFKPDSIAAINDGPINNGTIHEPHMSITDGYGIKLGDQVLAANKLSGSGIRIVDGGVEGGCVKSIDAQNTEKLKICGVYFEASDEGVSFGGAFNRTPSVRDSIFRGNGSNFANGAITYNCSASGDKGNFLFDNNDISGCIEDIYVRSQHNQLIGSITNNGLGQPVNVDTSFVESNGAQQAVYFLNNDNDSRKGLTEYYLSDSSETLSSVPNGSVINNDFFTNNRNITLMAATRGLEYTFINTVSDPNDVNIFAAGSDVILGNGASNVRVRLAQQNDAISIKCIRDGVWLTTYSNGAEFDF